MQASPLQEVIDRFGNNEETNVTLARKEAKEALVKAVREHVKKGDLLEDEFSDRGIEHVSNKKLLKLHDLAVLIQEEVGSRAALIDKLADLEGHGKDADYREHLEGFRLPELYSRYQAARKRSR